MRIELFGRVGLPLLNVSAEDSIQLMGVPPPGAEGGGDSISASRLTSEFGWGVGARLMSGNWGIEGSYNIFESLDLTPSWLVADSNGATAEEAALFGQPLVPSQARLVLGQAIRVFQLGGGAELSLGIGAGWLQATDSGTDMLLSGAGLEGLDQIPAEIPPSFIPEVSFEADRTSVVYAGSLGVAFRFGRIMLRPRVDVVVSRALTTDLTIGFPDLGELGPEELGESRTPLRHEREADHLPLFVGYRPRELIRGDGQGTAGRACCVSAGIRSGRGRGNFLVRTPDMRPFPVPQWPARAIYSNTTRQRHRIWLTRWTLTRRSGS